MRKIVLSVLVYLSFLSVSEGQERIILDAHTFILNNEGQRISMEKLEKLTSDGEWTYEQKYDENGAYLQLVKTTAPQKVKILELKDLYGITEDNVIGENAPNFSFKNSFGKKITKENTSGQIIVVNFWSSYNKHCAEAFPELNKLYDTYKSQNDVVFVSVSNEHIENVRPFLKKHPVNYPVITDASNEIAKFKIFSYPSYVIIGKDGKYLDYIEGNFKDIGSYISDTLKKALEK